MSSTPRFVFVGERPSAKAYATGATWQNRRLAGRTLADALEAAGADPGAHDYMNLYRRPERGHPHDRRHERQALAQIRRLRREGGEVVGLGERVCRVLRRAGIPHRAMIHPAARGAIRARPRYFEHARQVLAHPTDQREEN